MKPTIKAFLKNTGHINAKLVRAVINQIGGWESFQQSAIDVARHGIDGGFHGFIYYTDTHSFAVKNRKTIIELLESQANDIGEDVVQMVSSFGVFRNGGMDNDEKKNLYRYLGGGRSQQDSVTNVMAWFAAEEVCRAYEDYINQ